MGNLLYKKTMKKIDIEQLERKHIYKTPENFMEVMQSNVLKEIFTECNNTKSKTYQLKLWAYGVVASLLFILCITLLAINDKSESRITATPYNVKFPTMEHKDIRPEQSKEENKAKAEIATFKEYSTTIPTQLIKNNSATLYEKEGKKESPPQKNSGKEIRIDRILASFNSAELTEMSKESEMDIYLELYN